MPGIESKLTETVIESASKLLKKRTMGGVTTESATNAISNAAESVRTAANEQIGVAQREINQLRREANISATRIAELTSEKDAVVLQKEGLQSELETSMSVIEQLKAKLRTALGVKVGKPIELPNGNIRTVKTNKNGAVMTTETLPNGNKVSVEVQTPNGIRKTTYNPVTGKPLKTYTDINGSQIIEYDANGAAKASKKVNNKKVKPQKPTVVTREILSKKDGVITAQKTFSDGSYEICKIEERDKTAYQGTLFNSKGKKVKEWEARSGKIEKETTIYNPETGKKTSVIIECKKDRAYEGFFYESSREKFYNERGEIFKEVITFGEKGKEIKQIIKARVDEFGIVNTKNPSVEYIYPKSSKIKSSRVVFHDEFWPEKEVLTLRDGSTVEVRVNNNYNPYKVTIKEKGKSDEKIISDSNMVYDYLKSIGKELKLRDIHGDDVIYHNYLR